MGKPDTELSTPWTWADKGFFTPFQFPVNHAVPMPGTTRQQPSFQLQQWSKYLQDAFKGLDKPIRNVHFCEI